MMSALCELMAVDLKPAADAGLPTCVAVSARQLHYLRAKSDLPEALCSMPQLAVLHLHCYAVTRISRGFHVVSWHASSPRSVWLQITSLSSSVSALQALQILTRSQPSNLTALPDTLGHLSALPQLSLTNCRNLTALPDILGQLLALQQLELIQCRSLTALTDGLARLSVLQNFDLFGCSSLTDPPDSLVQLTALQYLDLFGCSSLGACRNPWISYRRYSG